jgi:putative endonuclease
MTDPRHAVGVRAEEVAAAWLTSAGWRVLATRWRCREGELDLVCLDPREALVGVEVRARRSARTGRPEESIDTRRVARLRHALAAYAAAARPAHAGRRIDLVALSPEPRDPLGRWRARRIPAIDGW